MTKTPSEAVLATLPLAPRNPLPLKQQLKAIRISTAAARYCATQVGR